MQVDVASNRKSRKYGLKELLCRVAWTICSISFRVSPRVMHGFRRSLLRCFGAKIGKHVQIYPSARIQYPWLLNIGDYTAIGDSVRLYNLGPLTIGSRVTISQFAHLCGGSHDYKSSDLKLLKLPITVEDDSWICADAFIGPNVKIGAGAVIGARSVVTRNVSPWCVVVGNPARKIGKREIQSQTNPKTEPGK
jgi:putative colanic acid biosynthesis acetyltransferase WcaF